MKKKSFLSQCLCLALVLVCFAASAEELNPYEGLYINEIMASNKAYFHTAYDSTPDWLELYNSSENDMDISGLWLSDSKKQLDKFCFPEGTVIKAGEYMVLHASGINGYADGVIQVPFKLSASGETVYIYQAGRLIDSVKYPSLEEDTSYARIENGEFAVTDSPTMGEDNVLSEKQD